MPRPLPFELDVAMLRSDRRPAYRVLIYDVRSTTDTINSVVRGVVLDADTGPREFTAEVLAVDIVEVAGNFVTSGVPTSTVTVTLADPNGRLDPAVDGTDLTGISRFLRRGNVVRVIEGDSRVDSLKWVRTFTGILVGQAGVDRGRAGGGAGSATVTIKAVGREADFVRQSRTTDEFQNGASYLTMGDEIARNVMGLDADEIDFIGWGTSVTTIPIQFVEQSPLVSIAQLMFVDGFLPRFDSDGKLTQTQGDVLKSPARIYPDLAIFNHVVRPFSELDPVNSVEVIGIEGALSEIVQQVQPLADVSVTTGYFTSDEEIFVYWSNDRTVLAKNVVLDVQRSVNGGLSTLGGGETFRTVKAENSTLTIGAKLELSTGYSPYVIVFLTAVYVVLAAIPDEVTTVLLVGITIPIGRIAQAGALAAILILMTKIGRGQYEFRGEPVEFVYKELRAIAELSGLSSEQLNRITIENHLCLNQSVCDDAARSVLFRQQAEGNPRTVTMLPDLRIVPDDVYEIPGGQRFLVERVSRRLVRDRLATLATLSVYEVTTGVAP